MKKISVLFLTLLSAISFSQDEDLLAGVEIEAESAVVTSAFKSMKIINFESTKIAAKGDLYFVASHRFNYIDQGLYDWFGLDGATVNLRFIYGLTDWLSVSVDRSSSTKVYQGNIKYRLVEQSESFPVCVVGYNGISFNTLKTGPNLPLSSAHRTSFVNQLLISRKLNKSISLELIPTHFHQNFVKQDDQANSQFVVGMGGRVKINSRVSVNMDYGYHLNRSASNDTLYNDPLSIGVDVETGGHVFQLHFTSAQSMDEIGYLANAAGDWTKGKVSFGFNMVRVF